MNPKVIGIVIFVFGAGVALYLYNSGGLTKLGSIIPSSNSSSTLSSSSTAGAQTSSSSSIGSSLSAFLSLFSGHPNTGPQTNNQNQQTYTAPTTGANGQTQISPADIPSGYTAAQLSPYFHQVHMSAVSGGQISLYSYSQQNTSSSVDITGWEIKTNRGGEFIPQAVNIYNPASANPESDIVLPLYANSNVYLYSNSAPTNVRINACMGYLNTAHNFNPSLPYNCPSIDRSQIANFSGQCQNYILSLGGCGTVDMSSPQIPQYDYACQQYLENNFTYNSCISNHSHDASFLSNTWYVWMGGNPLDAYHDNVALLDRNGLVVDAYNY